MIWQILPFLYYLVQCESSGQTKFELKNNNIINDGFSTCIIRGKEPGDVPWGVFGADIVVDATQKYKPREELQKYLTAGAKRVILSSLPGNGLDKLIIYGVNEDSISVSDQFISAGSSTTNSLAIALQTLNNKINIQCSNMTAIHAYTSVQPLQDVPAMTFAGASQLC